MVSISFTTDFFFGEDIARDLQIFYMNYWKMSTKLSFFFYISHGPFLHNGSNTSAYDLLNLLNKLRKKQIKCEACRSFRIFTQ